MIDFRYHIVSLIAVFLALALGLFLGSTTLQSTVTRNLDHQADRLTGDNKQLRGQKSALTSQVGSEQGLTAAVEPYAVSDQLAGQSVALIAAPGVSSKTHDALLTTLSEAGATVTADVALQPSFLDPTQDTELASLAADIALPTRPLPTGNGATKASAVLADMLVSKPGEQTPMHSRVVRALKVLETGKFIDLAGTPPAHTADLAILLVAEPSSSETTTASTAENAILLSLTRDLHASSSGTVLAGPRPTGSSDPGALTAARADATISKTVSTVNLDDVAAAANPPSGSPTGGDPAAGRIAIVLALEAEQSETVGSYGLGYGASAPVPAPSPSS